MRTPSDFHYHNRAGFCQVVGTSKNRLIVRWGGYMREVTVLTPLISRDMIKGNKDLLINYLRQIKQVLPGCHVGSEVSNCTHLIWALDGYVAKFVLPAQSEKQAHDAVARLHEIASSLQAPGVLPALSPINFAARQAVKFDQYLSQACHEHDTSGWVTHVTLVAANKSKYKIVLYLGDDDQLDVSATIKGLDVTTSMDAFQIHVNQHLIDQITENADTINKSVSKLRRNKSGYTLSDTKLSCVAELDQKDQILVCQECESNPAKNVPWTGQVFTALDQNELSNPQWKVLPAIFGHVGAKVGNTDRCVGFVLYDDYLVPIFSTSLTCDHVNRFAYCTAHSAYKIKHDGDDAYVYHQVEKLVKRCV